MYTDKCRIHSWKLQKFFTLPVSDLEAGEFYSSKFTQTAVEMFRNLQKQSKLIIFATACILFMNVGPIAVNFCRRRMGAPQARNVGPVGDAKYRQFDPIIVIEAFPGKELGETGQITKLLDIEDWKAEIQWTKGGTSWATLQRINNNIAPNSPSANVDDEVKEKIRKAKEAKKNADADAEERKQKAEIEAAQRKQKARKEAEERRRREEADAERKRIAAENEAKQKALENKKPTSFDRRLDAYMNGGDNEALRGLTDGW